MPFEHSAAVTISVPFFTEVTCLLVAESKKYGSHYLGTLDNDEGCSQYPDVAVQKMYKLQIRLISETLKNYWSTL
jgi:hypothetical protein